MAGVKKMVADFRRRGVKVFFPVMPWDAGTNQAGMPLWETAAKDMAQIGADGLNGDTMYGMNREYKDVSDSIGYPLALQPENCLSDYAMLAWNNMSWGYWKYQNVPVVSRYKWVEPRHMINVCERWAKNRTDGLQSAFFNGVGYESWENVWGIWNQLTPRDAEAIRRIATIERAMAGMLVSPDWQPHFPTLQQGIFASMFPTPDRTLWLIVNRTDADSHGEQITVTRNESAKYYDLWNGVELKPVLDGRNARLSFSVEAKGCGAILVVEGKQNIKDVKKLMARMTELTKTPLSSFSSEWKVMPQKIIEITPTKPAKAMPDGMVLIPAGKFNFKVTGVEIEGGKDSGVDVQYPWEKKPNKKHKKELDIKAFYIDKYPVTNAQFKKFLTAAGYKPRDSHNFLKDWTNGTFPAGWQNKPVTYVSIEDAREYAIWAGKRLPHEWEWQYAAQGQDGRLYPWGEAEDANKIPKPENGYTLRGPTDVDAFPQGASPFGVMDMTGNVWQWTDEFYDEHTRAAILRGGSYYRPDGSKWYFPANTRLDQHGKYLLMAPCKDRSGTVGFRCAMDTE
jgi:formylglycine-generating enzyme required for sulfatase activity